MTHSSILALSHKNLIRLTLACGAAILAYDPILWLVHTWRDPSYDSKGVYIFALCVALVVWSVTSPLRHDSKPAVKLALGLLGATALIRLIGQVLAINLVGAAALVVDVYALGLLLGLQHRARAISPAWLALAFALALPFERVVQRTMGYGLQNVSADGACALLGTVFDNVVCHGIRIILDGRDVLVDLPCSGARTLLLVALLFTVCASFARPNLRQAVAGIAVALVAALIANIVRISILAIGIARPDLLAGINVMMQPWHDIVGLVTLALAGLPVIAWMQYVPIPAPTACEGLEPDGVAIPYSLSNDSWWLAGETNARMPVAPLVGAVAFVSISIIIISLPRRPIDVVRKNISIDLPAQLLGTPRNDTPLTAKEKAYFVQYGGAAVKANYGPMALLAVRTSAPLRHLHAPDECLRGLGLDVEYMGARFSPLPTTIYKASAKDGSVYRIDVTFVSDTGFTTTNVSHAIWRWMQRPGSTWTAVQRITPWQFPDHSRETIDRAVAAHFDIASNQRLSVPTIPVQSATTTSALEIKEH